MNIRRRTERGASFLEFVFLLAALVAIAVPSLSAVGTMANESLEGPQEALCSRGANGVACETGGDLKDGQKEGQDVL